MLKRFLFPTNPNGVFISVILLAVRIVFGILMMNHGIDKWANYQELSTVFPDPLGIGSPLSLGLAIFGELACSMAFIIGFLYRLAMIPMIFTMCVAFFIIHGNDPFAGDGSAAGERPQQHHLHALRRESHKIAERLQKPGEKLHRPGSAEHSDADEQQHQSREDIHGGFKAACGSFAEHREHVHPAHGAENHDPCEQQWDYKISYLHAAPSSWKNARTALPRPPKPPGNTPIRSTRRGVFPSVGRLRGRS